MKYPILILLILLVISCSEKKIPADLIIQGGKIYTMNDLQPTVEAVAVIGKRIVYAGDATGAKQFQSEKTSIIDLQGKTMTPGFIEGHGHIMGLGYNEMNLDLMSVKNYEELVEKVKEAVAKAQPGQ